MEEMQTKEKQIVYDQALYEKAYEFAKEKHGTQKRIGGDPYITHPVAVADILKKEGYDIEYQIVALFHDLLEDTDAIEDEIRSIAGEEVLQAVKLLTKEKARSTSTITGVAPNKEIILRVETQVREGVITSSPLPIFNAISVICIPAVAELTAMAC